MREHLEVATADDMRALGRRIAADLRAGDLLVLSGPLGAGKTTLVQGIGEGLHVRGPVTSPVETEHLDVRSEYTMSIT